MSRCGGGPGPCGGGGDRPTCPPAPARNSKSNGQNNTITIRRSNTITIGIRIAIHRNSHGPLRWRAGPLRWRRRPTHFSIHSPNGSGEATPRRQVRGPRGGAGRSPHSSNSNGHINTITIIIAIAIAKTIRIAIAIHRNSHEPLRWRARPLRWRRRPTHLPPRTPPQ